MDSNESLEEFYRRKFDRVPENLKNEFGHFNVLRLDPYVGKNARPVPYKRRDFYKIMLVIPQKTTTRMIAERFLQEAKTLLKHSAWNVSEIAFALGFS